MAEKNPSSEMPLTSHLNELKGRMIRAALFFLVATGVAIGFHRQILKFLLAPAEDLNEFTGGMPIFTELTEFWGAVVKIGVLSGLALSVPVFLYQLAMFVAPGLSKNERKWLYLLLPFSLLSFASGVAFGYYVLLPPAIGFLLNFGGDVATPLIRIGSYVNLITMLLFWMGLVFELPIVMFGLARIGIISPKQIGSKRRYAVVGAFIVGAMITPTFDPVNQSLVAGPIIVLYEVGYWLSRLAARQRGHSTTEPSGA
jgi:sec-independent protein translocase protein TatC